MLSPLSEDGERKESAKDTAKLPDYLTPIKPMIGVSAGEKSIETNHMHADVKLDFSRVAMSLLPQMLAQTYANFEQTIEEEIQKDKEKAQTDPATKAAYEQKKADGIADAKAQIERYEKLEREAIEQEDPTKAVAYRAFADFYKKVLAAIDK